MSTNPLANMPDAPTVSPVSQSLYPSPETADDRNPEFNRQDIDAVPTAIIDNYNPMVEAIREMFKEADEASDLEMANWYGPEAWAPEYPNDTIAFRKFMSEVQRQLKDNDSIREIKNASTAGEPLTAAMVNNVFRAYARAVQQAYHSLQAELSPAQLWNMKRAGQSELDWGYRHVLLKHLTAVSAGGEVNCDPQDFFLILNPKARKISYMYKSEILKTLQRSMSTANQTQLQNDLTIISQHAQLPEVQAAVASEEYQTYKSLTPSTN